MRLLISTGIFPPDVGGPATYVPRIARALHDRGWDVEVLTAGTEPADRTFPYPVRRVPRPLVRRLPRAVYELLRCPNRVDRMYVNGLEWETFLARRWIDIPAVQKVVGDRSWERYRNRQRGCLDIESYQKAAIPIPSRMERWVQGRIARDATRIIVPSRYLKKIVRTWGVPERKIEVIYNTAHPPEEDPDGDINWPGRGARCLTVGRLVPWKRVPELLDLFAEVPDAGLVVLGDGPDRGRCRARLREDPDLKNRVQLRGSVPKPDVWHHLRECDLLILHSTYEGFPHVGLEALATGTPVAASASGGSRELAEFFPDRVILYPLEDPEPLRNILESGDLPTSSEPVQFPEPLQWETIVGQTARVLERAKDPRT